MLEPGQYNKNDKTILRLCMTQSRDVDGLESDLRNTSFPLDCNSEPLILSFYGYIIAVAMCHILQSIKLYSQAGRK